MKRYVPFILLLMLCLGQPAARANGPIAPGGAQDLGVPALDTQNLDPRSLDVQSLDDTFSAWRQAFEARIVHDLGSEAGARPNIASAWLARAFVARTAEWVVAAARPRFEVEIDRHRPGDPPPSSVRTPKIDSRRCPERGCDSNCGRDCKKTIRIGPYKDTKTDPVCYAACKVKKDLCETTKAHEKAACQAENLLRADLSDKKVGTLDVDGIEAWGSGRLDELRLGVAANLGDVRLRGRLAANLGLEGSFDFRPELLIQGALACSSFGGHTAARVELPGQDLDLEATVRTVDKADRLELLLELQPVKLTLDISGDPFLRAVSNDVTNLLRCPTLSAFGVTADMVTPSYKIERKFQVPGPVGMTFGTASFEVLPGTRMRVQPAGKALGLVEETALQTRSIDAQDSSSQEVAP